MPVHCQIKRKESASMAIWVLISPTIIPDGDATKKALKSADEFIIKTKVTELVIAALPTEKFDTDKDHEPKGNGKVLNALKFSPELKIKGETQGSQLTVSLSLTLTVEAIKTPEHKKGAELMVTGKKGVSSQNRGTLEKNLASTATDLLGEIVGALTKAMIEHPSFASYATAMNLPIPP
jgi:hypothetical protein